MGDYLGTLNLNSRKKPVAQYGKDALKGGIKKGELSDKSQLIFDAINNQDASKGNVDEILDANEIQNFWDKLREFAKDDTLGGREANRVLKDLGLKEFKKEDLYAFINELYGESEYVDSSFVDENDGTIVINYKEDEAGNTVQERVHTDKTSEIETTDSDKTVTTHFFDSQSHLTKETVVNANNDSETTLYTDGDGNAVLDDNNNSVPTHVSRVINNNGAKITTQIDYENGQPATAVVTEGEKTSNYIYQDELPVLTNTVENLGNNLQRTTNYEYTENGYIEHVTEPDKIIDRTIVNFATEDNRVVALTTNEVIKQGATTTTNAYDYQNNIKYETIVEGNGCQTQNIYGMVFNEEAGVTYAKLQQTKAINGKTYQINYDGQGNTCGIVVQNGESPAQIARKFGCSIEDLFAVNKSLVKGRGANRYFEVGAEIKIPKKELDADARVLQGRDSKEVAIRKYEIYQENEAMLKENGMINHGGRGQKVTLTVDGKEQTFTIRGEINGSHYIAINSEGQVVYINRKKNGALSVEGAQNIINYWNEVPEGVSEAEARNIKYGNTDYRAVAWRENSANGTRDDRQILLAEETGDLAVQSGARDRNPNGSGNKFIITNATYLKASDAYIAGTNKGKAGYGSQSNINLVTVNGQTFAFDAKGNAQDTNAVLSKTSKEIAKTLKAAADNSDAFYNVLGTTWGTDTDLQTKGLSALATYGNMSSGTATSNTASENNVYILANASLPEEYQNDKDGYDAVQTLLRDENSNGDVQTYVGQYLIDTGVYTDEQAGRFVANALEYELHGGFGITYQDDINRVNGLLKNRDARAAAERRMHEINSDLVQDQGSYIRSAIKNDGWTEHETNILDANGLARSYDQNNPEDLEHMKYLTDNLVFIEDASDTKAIDAGLYLIGTQGTDDNDPLFAYAQTKAGEVNANKGNEALIYGQDNLQTYLGNSCLNDGKVDLGQFQKYDNTLYYVDGLPVNIKAQLGMIDAKQGNAAEIFNLDADAADYVEEIINNDQSVQQLGIRSYSDLYNYALEKHPSSKLTIQAGAVLSGKIEFTEQEVVDVCINLMHAIDYNEGAANSTAYGNGILATGSAANSADSLELKLKKILSLRGDLLPQIRQAVNNGKFISGSVQSTTYIETDTKAKYLDMINNTPYVSNEAVFYDEQGNIITDSDTIEQLRNSNLRDVENMRMFVQQLNREHQLDLRKEGTISDAANAWYTATGDGIDRVDVETDYEEVELLLNNLEAAANGRLRINGKVISFNEYKTQLQEQAKNLQKTNASYNTAIATGKMVIKLAPVIVVTMVASGGSSTPLWVPALAAGGTTFALNTTEILTSDDPTNAQAWKDNYKETAVVAVSTGMGIGSAKGAYQLVNTSNQIINAVGRGAIMTASDLGNSVASEYVLTGNITVAGTIMGVAPGVAGNIVGLRGLSRKVPNSHTSAHTPTSTSTPTGTPTLTKAVRQVNSDGSVHVARPSQTHVGETKANVIIDEVNVTITRSDVTPQELAQARNKLDGIANSDVRGMRSSIDERASQLPPEQRAQYDAQVRADQEARVQDIPDRRYISEADGRALREYANGTDDIAGLTALRDRISPNQPGGLGARNILDTRINELTRQARTSNQIRTEVHSALDNAIAGNKGLGSLTDLQTHISATSNPVELNALFDKWMQVRKNCGSNRKQVDALFREKGLDISTPHKKLSVEAETPVQTHTEPAPAEPVVRNEQPQTVVRETEPAVPTRSEFFEQQFNDQLQASNVWKTAGDVHSVDRLGGRKVSEYTAEFDRLCRYATTPEQLDQLQLLANKFRGQAENTSFNMSIAKRRAELNNTPATEIRVNDHEIIMDAPRPANNDGVPVIEITNTPVVKKRRLSSCIDYN